MNVVHFGAGNIGRGLIGYLVKKDNNQLTFLDTDSNTVNLINEQNGYSLEIIGKTKKREFIEGVKAINTLKNERESLEELLNCDLITTSVGMQNLQRIVPLLNKSIKQRIEHDKSPIVIIANENSVNASSQLEKLVYENLTEKEIHEFRKYVSFVNSSIDRQAILSNCEENLVIVEEYFEWIINDSEKLGSSQRISSVKYVSNMNYYIERKLYCVNAGHAASAYIGKYFNKETVQDALAEDFIREQVENTILENGQYVMSKYNVSRKEIEEFSESIILRHGNPLLSDSVNRVGRNPIRKLSKGERLTGPLDFLYAENYKISTLSRTIAMALKFYDLEDVESVKMNEMIKTGGVFNTLKSITEIKNDSILREIEKIYNSL